MIDRRNYPSEICKVGIWYPAQLKTSLGAFKLKLKHNGKFDIWQEARKWYRPAWPELGYLEDEYVEEPERISKDVSSSYVDAEFWILEVE